MMERFYIFILAMYCVYASFYYFFIGQFNKHKPTMTKEEWDKKL
jgi:hypothetical protein